MPHRCSPRSPLAREIALALLVKLILLYGLWWAFFSHAPDKEAVARTAAERLSGVVAAPLPDIPSPTLSPKEAKP